MTFGSYYSLPKLSAGSSRLLRTVPGAGRRTVPASPGEIVGGRNFGEKRMPRRI